MSDPFSVFRVLPFYGIGECAVEWELQNGVPLTGDIHIYRSPTGLPHTWQWLTADNPLFGKTGSFVDQSLTRESAFTEWHYRGLVDHGGTNIATGNSVTARDSVRRDDYFIARAILLQEYRNMVHGRGERVLYYVPLGAGDGRAAAAKAIPETGQILGPGCKSDPAYGYGGIYAGGFHTPVSTWVLPLGGAEEKSSQREDGSGAPEEAALGIRLLAHPKPRVGHLLVFADSDRRYVLDEPVKPFRTKGGIPLFWEATGLLLPQDDPRHKLAVPDWNANRLSCARRAPESALRLDSDRILGADIELVVAPA